MSLLALYTQRSTPRAPTWYAVPLRLIVGFGFMEHGWALAWATITVELMGGVAVLVGSFIPLAGIPMAVVLLVAIFTVHVPNGFSSIKLESFDGTGAHFGEPRYEPTSSISQGSSL